MFNEFIRDLEKARGAEILVMELLQEKNKDNFTFEDVANQKEYYYKGDIKAIEKATGAEIYIEVKDDSRIAQTRNVLCEDKVWYHNGRYYGKGNMQNEETSFYCVVSKSERKVYIMDFQLLKSIYKSQGYYREIPHSDQTTICYLLPLYKVEAAGGLLGIMEY